MTSKKNFRQKFMLFFFILLITFFIFLFYKRNKVDCVQCWFQWTSALFVVVRERNNPVDWKKVLLVAFLCCWRIQNPWKKDIKAHQEIINKQILETKLVNWIRQLWLTLKCVWRKLCGNKKVTFWHKTNQIFIIQKKGFFIKLIALKLYQHLKNLELWREKKLYENSDGSSQLV